MKKRGHTRAGKGNREPGAYGRGGVQELPSGRFRVRITVDGERVTGTCDTRSEAEELRRGLMQEASKWEREAAPRPAAPVVTLGSWGTTWLARRRSRVRWFANDKSRWSLYVAPSSLASMPLAELRPRHVRAWLADLSETKRDGELLTTRTVRHVLNLVRKALADAVDEEFLTTNPAAGMKVPRRQGAAESAVREYLTAAEVETVERGENIPEAARLLYVVAIYTGLRQGELWGLRWGDVLDGDVRPSVVVRWSHTNAPKNGKVQPVPLLPKAREAFARLRALAVMDGDGPDGEALVFPSPRGHQRPVSDDAGWSSRKVHGRPRVGHREALHLNPRVTFHGLRHTCASHLIMGTWGITLPTAEVRAFLRHASVTTTERYAHLAPGHLHARVATMPVAPQRGLDGARGDGSPSVAPSPATERPEGAFAGLSAGVSNSGHGDPSKIGHAAGEILSKPLVFPARDTGFEPVALGFGDPRSIQLS